MHVLTEESLHERVTADADSKSVFAVITLAESSTTQLLRVDPNEIRSYEYRQEENKERTGELIERRRSRLVETTLALEHRLDSSNGRIVEAHQLRLEGPAATDALRGEIDLVRYTQDERQALVDGLTRLI